MWAVNAQRWPPPGAPRHAIKCRRHIARDREGVSRVGLMPSCRKLRSGLVEVQLGKVDRTLEGLGEHVAVASHEDAHFLALLLAQRGNRPFQGFGQRFGQLQHLVVTVGFGLISEQALRLPRSAVDYLDGHSSLLPSFPRLLDTVWIYSICFCHYRAIPHW